MRNRIAFSQTATGSCDRSTVDFDFRATTTQGSGAAPGVPTSQNFDTPGTTLHWPTVEPSRQPFFRKTPIRPAVFCAWFRFWPAAWRCRVCRHRPRTFNSIAATFDFRITAPSGAMPADGLGFALLNTASYGTNGAAPYFSEEPNLSSSLGIGFDVYNNASTPQEPNNNHVSLHWNGAQVGTAVTPSFSLSSGKFHRAQVIVWFSGNNAYVTVRLTPDINGTD
jgi:hypothetical protein